MFKPPVFREERTEVMHDLMRNHPFATLVSNVAGALSADHLPLAIHPEASANGVIRGHIAKANPLWRQTQRGGDAPLTVLAVFQGPQAYITPSWYPSKAEHGKVVPTLNYAVVHAHGTLQFTAEPDWLMAHLVDLTARHEGHRAEPWAVTDAPDEFIVRQLKGLVGFEIAIETLVGNWKVSQNKSEHDRVGVEQGLLSEDAGQAAIMSGLVQAAAK